MRRGVSLRLQVVRKLYDAPGLAALAFQGVRCGTHIATQGATMSYPEGGVKKLCVAAMWMMVASGGLEKEPVAAVDLGAEEAPAGKDDSALSPASLTAVTLGQVVRTTFTTVRRWRGFTFAGTTGQKV